MSALLYADAPARNTRSSQSSPQQSQENPTSSLYELTVLPMVKDTVGQRNTSSTKLATYICGGASWSEIKTKIFEKYKAMCLGIAQRNDEGVWSVLDDQVDESSFAKIFSLRSGTHVRKLDTDPIMNDWLRSVRGIQVSLSIYKYGNEIATKEQLLDFTAACIAPGLQDRSGAPSESTIQEFMGKLHAKWDDTWEAANPIWRIWASHVVRPPLLAWESRVSQGPPPHVLSRLRPKTSVHEIRMESFNRTIRTALDIVDGSLGELGHIRGAVDVVLQRLTMFNQSLVAMRDILVAMEHDLAPIPSDEVATTELQENQNILDTDHNYTLEGMD
ncbi:unnamed protein product [Aphanomyces euteiches]|nr:hypothetical protein AeRB84_016898 [Aphanomyces euteiches]